MSFQNLLLNERTDIDVRTFAAKILNVEEQIQTSVRISSKIRWKNDLGGKGVI